MADPAAIIQKLRLLGLTRTEAEVYLAVLQESSAGPVSGYRVAQAMGRDPANLAKNLSALEKQGAVRVIQEKPRLYLPVLPVEITASLVEQMREAGKELVSQLEQFAEPRSSGLTLALRNNEQALDRAAELMRTCREELLIFASKDVVDYLAREFGELASRSDCRVRYLGVEPSGIALAEDTVIPMPEGFSEDGPLPWLQMIVDRKAWLIARFNRPDSSEFPCGWWSDDSAMAGIMAVSLDSICHGATYEFTAHPAPAAKETETTPTGEEVTPEPEPEAVPEPGFESGVLGNGERQEGGEEEEEDGFKFVVRHDK